MLLSPSWESTWPSASQEILRNLGKPKVHYFIHKLLPPVHIMSQNISVHDLPSQLLKIYFNIIVLSIQHRSCKWLRSFGSPHQNPVRSSPASTTFYTPSCGDLHARRDDPSQACIRLTSQQLSVWYIASLRATSRLSSREFLQGHTFWCSCSTHTHVALMWPMSVKVSYVTLSCGVCISRRLCHVVPNVGCNSRFALWCLFWCPGHVFTPPTHFHDKIHRAVFRVKF